MVNTCVIAYCKTGYTKRQNKIDFVAERFPVFRFPGEKSRFKQKMDQVCKSQRLGSA